MLKGITLLRRCFKGYPRTGDYLCSGEHFYLLEYRRVLLIISLHGSPCGGTIIRYHILWYLMRIYDNSNIVTNNDTIATLFIIGIYGITITSPAIYNKALIGSSCKENLRTYGNLHSRGNIYLSSVRFIVGCR